jgi:hypothetical protein
MKRTIKDAAITAGGVLVLVLALFAFDRDLRTQVAAELSSQPPVALSNISYRAQDVARIVVTTVREQTRQRTALVAFACASVVLTVFMFRT